VLQDIESHNQGIIEEYATITGKVSIGRGTIIHSRTTIRGPAIMGEGCEISLNAYIGPSTSIGDHATILNIEIENSIVMEGTNIDCSRRITNSLIGRNVRILGYEQNLPKGHKLILGEMATVTL
jgi:NDP-sugar pyrophosphorylase family protein